MPKLKIEEYLTIKENDLTKNEDNLAKNEDDIINNENDLTKQEVDLTKNENDPLQSPLKKRLTYRSFLYKMRHIWVSQILIIIFYVAVDYTLTGG